MMWGHGWLISSSAAEAGFRHLHNMPAQKALLRGTEAAACSGCMCGANCTASRALHRGSMAARAAGSERSGAALTCHVLECHALACLYGWVGGRNLTQRNEVRMGKHSIMDAQELNHAGGR